ncbi:MAG: hypothetical protein OXE97_01330 [Gammaproteobacteria bacterium]|nr:hypothetical protein [Gammaproteobacteria bacterium]
MTWKDPIVEEVREIRDRIAARFDYDVKAIGRYYQQKQRESKSKKIPHSPGDLGIQAKSRQGCA